MSAAEEKISALWVQLWQWYGQDVADLVAAANNWGVFDDFDEPPLWETDPDLTLVIGDLIDVDSMLDFGGCLDAP